MATVQFYSGYYIYESGNGIFLGHDEDVEVTSISKMDAYCFIMMHYEDLVND